MRRGTHPCTPFANSNPCPSGSTLPLRCFPLVGLNVSIFQAALVYLPLLSPNSSCSGCPSPNAPPSAPLFSAKDAAGLASLTLCVKLESRPKGAGVLRDGPGPPGDGGRDRERDCVSRFERPIWTTFSITTLSSQEIGCISVESKIAIVWTARNLTLMPEMRRSDWGDKGSPWPYVERTMEVNTERRAVCQPATS